MQSLEVICVGSYEIMQFSIHAEALPLGNFIMSIFTLVKLHIQGSGLRRGLGNTGKICRFFGLNLMDLG